MNHLMACYAAANRNQTEAKTERVGVKGGKREIQIKKGLGKHETATVNTVEQGSGWNNTAVLRFDSFLAC